MKDHKDMSRETLLNTVKEMHSHAAGCKKPLDKCKGCIGIIAFFGSLPPQTLSDVLTDRGKTLRAH